MTFIKPPAVAGSSDPAGPVVTCRLCMPDAKELSDSPLFSETSVGTSKACLGSDMPHGIRVANPELVACPSGARADEGEAKKVAQGAVDGER